MLNYPWKNQDRNLDTTSSRIYPLLKLGEIIIEGIEIKPDPNTFLKEIDLNLPLKPRSIRSLQAQDAKSNVILWKLEVGDLDANVYIIEDGILKRRIVETTSNEFKPIVLPKSMVDHVLLTITVDTMDFLGCMQQ